MKYLIKKGIRGMFKVSDDGSTIDVIDYLRTNIDWVYQADDDGQLIFRDGDEQITKNVKKGDLVIVFYSVEGIINKVIVIDSKEWKDNIANVKQVALPKPPAENVAEAA